MDACFAFGVLCVRRGTFARSHLDKGTIRAASMGGALTCASVLRMEGVHLHREYPHFEMDNRWRVSRMRALWRAVRCLDEENAVAALESAIHEQFLSADDVRKIGRLAPRRLQPLLRQLVVNSGSGNQTIVRIRPIRAGHRAQPQPFRHVAADVGRHRTRGRRCSPRARTPQRPHLRFLR
jgi:hypothetical protein